MIHIYTGNRDYLINHYLHVYKCCYDMHLFSPEELIAYVSDRVEDARKHPRQRLYFVTHQPDFISTMVYACQTVGLKCKLYVNGKQTDLEGVFAFLNKGMDKAREYLESLKREVENESK